MNLTRKVRRFALETQWQKTVKCDFFHCLPCHGTRRALSNGIKFDRRHSVGFRAISVERQKTSARKRPSPQSSSASRIWTLRPFAGAVRRLC
jgi:hypothetical protein